MAELGVMRRVVVPPAMGKTAKKEAAPAAPGDASDDGAVRLLAVLQREARLLDFLYEDIGGYSDDQVGAAVRGVHDDCRKALDRVVQLAPVVDGVEGAPMQLASAGLKPGDSARVKLLGNVPPDGAVESGLLQHKGWQVKGLSLPPPDAASRAHVLAPAEIEVE